MLLFTIMQASLSQRGKILTDPFNQYYWSISHKGINHTFSDIGAVFESWSLTVSCKNIIYSMICQFQPSHPSLYRGFKTVSLYGFMCLRLSGPECVHILKKAFLHRLKVIFFHFMKWMLFCSFHAQWVWVFYNILPCKEVTTHQDYMPYWKKWGETKRFQCSRIKIKSFLFFFCIKTFCFLTFQPWYLDGYTYASY